MARKVGIKEISERAGVAMSTVSHALNGTAPISDEVRQRILEVANDLGYLARRKAKGAIATLRKVMILIPSSALPQSDVNLYSWTMLRALTRDCEDRGIKLAPQELRVGDGPDVVMDAISKASPDGVLLVNKDDPALLEALHTSGLPAVLINGEDPLMQIDSVTPANYFAAQQAVEWLIGLGHRRVAHLTWQGRKTVERRRDGFADTLRAHAMDPAGLVIEAEGFEPEAGRQAVSDWLSRREAAGVTALFCAADNLAFGAIEALRDAGLSVPEDMSVMGFDGLALGGLSTPSLATVSVPLDQFGAEALRLLEQRALKEPRPRAARRVELGCTLVARDSVAKIGGA